MSKIKFAFRTLMFNLIALFVGNFLPAYSQNFVSSGANVKIFPGAFLISTRNLVVGNGAELLVDGSLILKENLTNQNLSDNLGTGTLEFSGTTPQTISGLNTIGNLTVNNASGLNISGNTVVNTGLKLLSGHI